MDHDLELFIPILEIVEIEVRNILYNPGNIAKRIFSIQTYPGNSGSYDPYISPILEILDRTIHISVLSWKYWIVRSIFAPMLMSRGVAGGRGGLGDCGGGAGGNGGDVPTTLPSGQSPGPSRPGTKYPVRGQSLTSTYMFSSGVTHMIADKQGKLARQQTTS